MIDFTVIDKSAASRIAELEKQVVEKDFQIAKLKNDMDSSLNNHSADMAVARQSDFRDSLINIDGPEGWMAAPFIPTVGMRDKGAEMLQTCIDDKRGLDEMAYQCFIVMMGASPVLPKENS